MAVIVLIERERTFDPDDLSSVRVVHAAEADPDVPEDPLPVTLCGRDTARLIHFHYQPSRPGDHWYPAELSDKTCRECDAALRHR